MNLAPLQFGLVAVPDSVYPEAAALVVALAALHSLYPNSETAVLAPLYLETASVP